ncbi:MAG TPA: hypothetical protein VI299_19460, partial [Polyangiales bacterium]
MKARAWHWRAASTLLWLAASARAQPLESATPQLGDAAVPAEPTPADPTPADTTSVEAPTDAEPLIASDEALAPELSKSELEELGLDRAGSRFDSQYHFSGFADFTSASLINPRGTAAFGVGKNQSFYIGNVNLYLSKNLSESVRTMGEVRLTYLPNGNFGLDENKGYVAQDTSVLDYANGVSTTRWGGIILQRVYIEWTPWRWVTIRAGQYLTPLGIWNVDHGSPAYIPAQRPHAITSGIFPERQTGLELFGRWNAGNHDTLGYHLTLSNGTGPVSEYRDLDKNKAVGGRAYWEHYGRVYTRLGTSGYYGRDSAITTKVAMTDQGLALNEQPTESD